MKVVKCINNNVVSCLDENGRELIAMGKGLGFSLRPGDRLARERAEKLFAMQTPDQTRKLTDLFATFPPQQIELCSRIAERAEKVLGRALSPSIYLTLTDHVCFAIQRMQSGTVFENALLAEVRTFYPREFTVGKYALELLRQEMQIDFPEDEAASIALHIVNAEYENSISDTLRMTQTLKDILQTLQGWPHLEFDPASDFYDEFTVSLKFLVFRSFSGKLPPRPEPRFVQAVQACYPAEFDCLCQVAKGLRSRIGCDIPQEEIAYLAASLHRTCKKGI